jgi:transposase-like protein
MEDQVTLLGAQFVHLMDVMDAKLDRIELNQEHLKELIEHRLNYLEKQVEDHEARLREATEGVTQFKVRSGFTSIISGILSILAMVKAFFGD